MQSAAMTKGSSFTCVSLSITILVTLSVTIWQSPFGPHSACEFGHDRECRVPGLLRLDQYVRLKHESRLVANLALPVVQHAHHSCRRLGIDSPQSSDILSRSAANEPRLSRYIRYITSVRCGDR